MTAPSSEDSHYYIISESQYKKIQDIALLLKAVNIPFFTKQTAEHTTFFIPAEYSAKAKEELALFTKENASWPNVLELWSSAPLPFSFLHEVTIVLLAFFYGVVGQTRYEDWVNQGAVSAAHVLEGEWGRIFTGLTLHADIFHILFNLFFLWIFLHLLGQVIGNGTAWFFVLLSGGLGNYCNAAFYEYGHRSIGSSTAVFGSLGILVGIQFVKKIWSTPFFTQKCIPITAGLGILAMIGAGQHTDVLAHLFGFLVGFIIGIVGKVFTKNGLPENKKIQAAFYGVFLCVVLLSWTIQIRQ